MPVNSRHPEYQVNLRRWRVCRAVCEGEDAVKDLGNVPGTSQELAQVLGWPAQPGTGGVAAGYGVSWEILPPLSGHTTFASYWTYVQHAHFFPAAGRAREGMAGLLRKDEVTVTHPEEMNAFGEDVTGSGSPLDVDEFADQVIFEIMTTGRCGVLTDYPPRPKAANGAPAPPPNLRDAEALGLRPRWKLYKAEQIINWRTDRVRGKEMLGLVVLEEPSVAPPTADAVDDFAWIPVLQWRVLDRALPPAELADKLPQEAAFGDRKAYRVRFFALGQDGQFVQANEVFPMVNGVLSEEIPFEFVGSSDCSPACDKPPLYDVVTVNIGHYRSCAAIEHGALFCANPMPYLFGYDPEAELDAMDAAGTRPPTPALHWRLGSSQILVLKNPNAKIGVLSASAQDLGALEKRIEVKREELSAIVGRILATEKKAAEAAQTEKVRRQGEEGILSALASNVSAALTRSLARARDYMGVAGDVDVEVPTQFWDTGISAVEATAIADLWMKYGVIAKSDVRQQLRDSGFLTRSDEDVDAELALEPIPSAPPLLVPGESLAAVGGKPGEPTPMEPPGGGKSGKGGGSPATPPPAK